MKRECRLRRRPDRDGRVTLDVCIMDEKNGILVRWHLRTYQKSISVARAVMEKTPLHALVGDGDIAISAVSRVLKK